MKPPVVKQDAGPHPAASTDAGARVRRTSQQPSLFLRIWAVFQGSIREGPGKTAAAIFLGVLVLYQVNGRPHAGCDTFAAPYTAWTLVRTGSWDVHAYPELKPFLGTHIRALPDGRWMTIRPGAALACVGVVAPFALLREQPFSATAMHHLGKIAAGLHVAGAACLFFLLCRRLAPAAAGPATALLAFGTSLYSIGGMASWTHGLAAFWLTVALYLLLAPTPRVRTGFVAGLALGAAVFIRGTTGLFGAAAIIGLLWRRRWGSLLGLVLGLIPPLAGLLLYNRAYMGDALLGGYALDDWQTRTPLHLGLAGLLVAPSRGLLVYTPAFLLVPFGLWALLRRPAQTTPGQRGMILLWFAATAATVVFYARWWCWWGGWCFGPRFLCECAPLLCLLFAFAFVSLRSVAARRGAVALIAVSILVHIAGVFGHTDAWNSRHEGPVPVMSRRMFELRDTQIEASLRHMLRIEASEAVSPGDSEQAQNRERIAN